MEEKKKDQVPELKDNELDQVAGGAGRGNDRPDPEKEEPKLDKRRKGY